MVTLVLKSIFDLRTHLKELLCVDQDRAVTNVQMAIGARFVAVTAAVKYTKLLASEFWRAVNAEPGLPRSILPIPHREFYCAVRCRGV